MRWRGHFLASAAVATGACSLLVDTSGLTGTAATASGVLTDAAAGAPETGGPAADGGAPPLACDGGFETTSFDSFDQPGNVTVDASGLSATATIDAPGPKASAAAQKVVVLTPSRIHLAYDLVVKRHPTIYTEPGCSLYLENGNEDVLFRHTFYMNKNAFGQYVNIVNAVVDDRPHAFFDLPDEESTHRVDIVLIATGALGSVDVTFGAQKQNHKETYALSTVPRQVRVRCGISFAEQTVAGPGSVTVKIKNLVLAICP